MFVDFSFSQRMEYMIFGTGLMIEPGNHYLTLTDIFYDYVYVSVPVIFSCIVTDSICSTSIKVSPWSCDWWHCLPRIDLDCRLHMVVSI